MRPVRLTTIAGALVAAAVLGVVVPWSSAGAQSAGPKLALTAITPFLLPSDPTFELSLSVTGPPAGGPLAVTVERYDDISNNADPRGQLDAWLSGRREVPKTPKPPDRSSVFTTEVPDGGGPVSIPVSRDSRSQPANGFTITDAGVFPLVVRLHTREGRQLGEPLRTFLIRLPNQAAKPEEQPPLKVATILGLRAPVALRPDGIRQLADNDTARLNETVKLLSDHPSPNLLTVDPQPETIAALASGKIDPAVVLNAIGPRQVLSSTLVDIDVTRFVEADLRDQVERQRQIGLDALTTIFQRPDSAFDTGTMVARHPLSASARAALSTTAPDSVRQLVVGAAGVGPVEQRTPAGADADLQPFSLTHPGGRSLAVLWDERLSGRLTATGDRVLDAQATLADLAILACGSRTGRQHCNTLPTAARGIALVVPDEVAGVKALDQLLDVLANRRQWLVELTDLRGLFALKPAATPSSAEPVVRTYNATTNDGDLRGYAARLNDVASGVAAYRSMLVAPPPTDPASTTTTTAPGAPGQAPEPLPTVKADLLTQLLDVSGAGAPAASGPYLDAVSSRLDEIFTSVRMPVQRPITLTDSSGTVQVAVENRLRYPVTVKVVLDSDKPVFDQGRSVTIDQELPPATDAGPAVVQVPVPVHGVTSGLPPLDVRVIAPNGMPLGTAQIEVRSTVVSWVGLLLTIAAGVVLVVWWARHFRDARRARKLVQVEDVDEAVAIATGETPAVGNAGVGPRV